MNPTGDELPVRRLVCSGRRTDADGGRGQNARLEDLGVAVTETEVRVVVRVEAVVNFVIEVVAVHLADRVENVVVGDARQVGQRVERGDLQSDRVKPRGWNDVSRELRPRERTALRRCRGRIEDAVRVCREIAAPEGLGRHGGDRGLRLPVARSLPRSEEKSPVAISIESARQQRRAAEGRAVLVEDEFRVALFARVEETFRVENRVAVELEEVAVEFAPARFVGDVDGRAASAPVLRAEVVGLDLELGQRVERRVKDNAQPIVVLVDVDPLDHYVVVFGALPVDGGDRHAALGRDGQGARSLRAGRDGAGGQVDELREVARVDRQIHDRLLRADVAERRALGLDDRAGGHDLSRLAHLTDFQLQVNARNLANLESDVRPVGRFEARLLHGDLIRARRQQRHGVIALVVRRGLSRDAGQSLRDGQGCPGDNRAARVGYAPGELRGLR